MLRSQLMLRTPEGKKVVANRATDVCLYHAPRNPPNTGTAYTSGADLYVHRARSGAGYYYLYDWSMWQGTSDSAELISEAQAREFLLERRSLNIPWDSFDDEEIERRFPGIFDEDA